MRVLITGGAGFIGLHLVKRLLKEECEVTILDTFSPQVHGSNRNLPPDVALRINLIRGDVRDRVVLSKALAGQEVIVHLAAETGTGQSMYEVERYADVNIRGTAVLLDILMNCKSNSAKKIIVASSRAIYGEGRYRCPTHKSVFPAMRKKVDMEVGIFDPLCPYCDKICVSVPTPEMSRIQPTSFYGLTKQVQEQMVLMFARTLGVNAFALRYQNVYGSGQSLSNPYTGILAIFANLARTNGTLNVFEDGLESRDFVHINDVIEATWLCLRPEVSGIEALNIGSGEGITVKKVAEEIVCFFKSKSKIIVSGSFRLGDIRHNVADIKKARRLLDFKPKWRFTEGLTEFLKWVQEEQIHVGRYEESLNEMRERGLMSG